MRPNTYPYALSGDLLSILNTVRAERGVHVSKLNFESEEDYEFLTFNGFLNVSPYGECFIGNTHPKEWVS